MMTESNLPHFDDALLAAARLFREGRKQALKDETVDSIQSLLRALELLDPMQGNDHRLLRCEVLQQLGMVEIWRGRYGTAHDMLDEATKLNPDKGMAWAYLSQASLGLEAKEKAVRCAEKAIGIDDKLFIAHHMLATAYQSLGNSEKALTCYQRAGEVTEPTADAFYMLGNCCYVGDQKEEAEKWYSKALALNPDHADANYGYSVCLTENLKYREALPFIIKGMGSQISGHAAQWSKALAHLILGEYEQGWKDHEVRFLFMRQEYGNALAEKRFDKPSWQPDKSGKVHLYSEQGFGDAIQFSRFVHEVAKTNSVIFEVDKSMLGLMRWNFPDAEVVPMSLDYPGAIAIGPCDYRMPLGSMPYAFGTTLETIPSPDKYLTAEPEYIKKWENVSYGFRKKVGICWAGGKRVQDKNLVAMDEKRSVSFEQIKTLLDIEGCKFFSLQTGLPADEGKGDARLHKLDIKSWSDTAGIISNLDVVISVDTSVLHLAAAMGKQTYLLNKYSTCWRWLLGREDSPWYKSIHIFRQPNADDWQTPIHHIKEALK